MSETFEEIAWIGVPVHDQASADERIPRLLNMQAKKRFVICDELTGPVDLTKIETICSFSDEPMTFNALSPDVDDGLYSEDPDMADPDPENEEPTCRRLNFVLVPARDGSDYSDEQIDVRHQCYKNGVAFADPENIKRVRTIHK